MQPPRAFVSYSHDSLEHKKWVLDFATTLRQRGIDAILDQWELKPGGDLPHFMETELEKADFALMICTENYVRKANEGTGGVGYEKMIMTSSMLSRIDRSKVIPIIRQIGTRDVPIFLKSKVYVDFSKDEDAEYSFDELLRTLLNAPLFEKPELGSNPFQSLERSRPDRTSGGVRQVMTDVAAAYEGTHRPFLLYAVLVRKTTLSRMTLDTYVNQAIEEGLLEKPNLSEPAVQITRKGLAYLADKGIIEIYSGPHISDSSLSCAQS
jgi:hypothetical protein